LFNLFLAAELVKSTTPEKEETIKLEENNDSASLLNNSATTTIINSQQILPTTSSNILNTSSSFLCNNAIPFSSINFNQQNNQLFDYGNNNVENNFSKISASSNNVAFASGIFNN
jgi:hypothetical protein